MLTTRQFIAGRFGWLEHSLALLLGVFLIGQFLVHQTFLHFFSALLWLGYHLAHRLEKLFYGRHGFR